MPQDPIRDPIPENVPANENPTSEIPSSPTGVPPAQAHPGFQERLQHLAHNHVARYIAAGLLGAILGGGLVAVTGAVIISEMHEDSGWSQHHERHGGNQPGPDKDGGNQPGPDKNWNQPNNERGDR